MKLFGLAFYYLSALTLIAAQRGSLQCGQVSRAKRTVLENPTQLSDSCQYTIEAYSPYTCQLLIQFEKFELQQPTLSLATLTCVDRLIVGGFRLCGNNAQQHLYIPIEGMASSGKKGRVSLNFEIPSRWAKTRWSLVVTQLECPHTSELFRLSNVPGLAFLQSVENATRTFFPPPSFGDLDLLAPRGCHQYYTSAVGTIRSFNFDAALETLYMPNMEYVICVKAAGGVQEIDYTVEKFSLSIEQVSRMGFDMDCHSTILTPGRHADFLLIPQSVLPNLPAFRPTHYCGHSLASHRVTASLPFLMYFQSDSLADPTETGFLIHYRVK